MYHHPSTQQVLNKSQISNLKEWRHDLGSYDAAFSNTEQKDTVLAKKRITKKNSKVKLDIYIYITFYKDSFTFTPSGRQT